MGWFGFFGLLAAGRGDTLGCLANLFLSHQAQQRDIESAKLCLQAKVIEDQQQRHIDLLNQEKCLQARMERQRQNESEFQKTDDIKAGLDRSCAHRLTPHQWEETDKILRGRVRNFRGGTDQGHKANPKEEIDKTPLHLNEDIIIDEIWYMVLTREDTEYFLKYSFGDDWIQEDLTPSTLYERWNKIHCNPDNYQDELEVPEKLDANNPSDIALENIIWQWKSSDGFKELKRRYKNMVNVFLSNNIKIPNYKLVQLSFSHAIAKE